MKTLPKRRLLIQGRCEDCMLGKQPPRPCSSSGLDMLTMNRAPSRWHPSLPAVQLNCSGRESSLELRRGRPSMHRRAVTSQTVTRLPMWELQGDIINFS